MFAAHRDQYVTANRQAFSRPFDAVLDISCDVICTPADASFKYSANPWGTKSAVT
jgi:hypothetical protein